MSNTDVVKFLGSCSDSELMLINRCVVRMVNGRLTAEQAIKVEDFHVGDNVKFVDKKGHERKGQIAKINRRYIITKTNNKLVRTFATQLKVEPSKSKAKPVSDNRLAA